MMSKALWTLIKLAYKSLLRPLVIEAVENSETEWDDRLLAIVDRIFEYDGKNE